MKKQISVAILALALMSVCMMTSFAAQSDQLQVIDDQLVTAAHAVIKEYEKHYLIY